VKRFPSIGKRFPSPGKRFPSIGWRFPLFGTRFPSIGRRFPWIGKHSARSSSPVCLRRNPVTPYNSSVSDAPAQASALPRPGRREAATVYVVGFWRRAAAAFVDALVIVPAALVVALIAGKLAGVSPPATRPRLLDVDLWIDLVLATDPALVMAVVLLVAIAMTYLLVFQITAGRTPGMRLFKIKIIDVWGDRPSPGRCAVRCLGYLVGLATLFLGFLWMGFDSEKRGLHDWIAGTYVIRA
jgi:uncharacterized RDD family membrane protein YckC